MSARQDEDRAPISDMNRSSFGMAAAIRTATGEKAFELVRRSILTALSKYSQQTKITTRKRLISEILTS